jgi:NCS1 family nucleobase:cation symporter-1
MQQHPSHGQLPPGYSERLYNEDLGPLKEKNWNWYNIFAFWMSDVHSVGGYVFSGSLFALGLASWQVLACLLIGITIVQLMSNLIAKPSQQGGIPYPVVCRMSFGVFGANIPAVIRGLIAVAWYGIQTFLASSALVLVLLRFFPALAPLAKVSFVGLSALGWIGFMTMWVLQALVFWHGMESIKKFIDWAGPAVYVVMFLLMAWIVWKAGWDKIDFSLGSKKLHGGEALWQMVVAIALVVSYFSGPLLNFGDFSRYCRSMDDLKKGNFWGLPINFLAFSLVSVTVISGTIPVFGHMIQDPIETVSKIDSTMAAVLGAFTFVTATIGINIVANFVSPAFDFSNVAPSKISWRMGGMIAAVGSIFITPWNLFNSPATIHYTLDILASFIGPLFGILLVDFFLVQKQKIDVNALYSEQPGNTYWYENGYNKAAIKALVPAALIGVAITFTPGLSELANFAWFIGCGVGGLLYRFLARCPDAIARMEPSRS